MAKKINKPNGWDEKLKSRLQWLTPEEKDELLEILKQDKKERSKPSFESLFWNEKAILEDIKKNCLTTTWDVTYNVQYGLDKEIPIWWRVVKIDLPAIWDFKWFKMDLFIWGDVECQDLAFRKKIVKNLCSREKLEELLRAINGYMRAHWVIVDENVDFNWDLDGVPCKTWEYVEELLRLWGGWLRGEKTKFGSKLLDFTLFPDRNGWEKAHYEEPYYYDNPESDSIPPSDSLIVLLSD